MIYNVFHVKIHVMNFVIKCTCLRLARKLRKCPKAGLAKPNFSLAVPTILLNKLDSGTAKPKSSLAVPPSILSMLDSGTAKPNLSLAVPLVGAQIH